MRVADVMTTQVVTARPGTSLKEAARRLVEAGVSGLPVLDEGGDVVGVVTEADFLERRKGRRGLLQLLFGDRDLPQAETVEEAMSGPVVTIGPDASLSEAARLMADRRINRLPVLGEDGRLLGIVSRADVLPPARPGRPGPRPGAAGIARLVRPAGP